MHTLPPGREIICFLIDDDKDDQEIFRLALQDFNLPIHCFTADDGYLALCKFEEEPAFVPDLIFLDLNMPRINGMQCLREIKNTPRLAHVPVIIYSTSSRESDKHASAMLGAEDFVTKLADIDELGLALCSIFNKHLGLMKQLHLNGNIKTEI